MSRKGPYNDQLRKNLQFTKTNHEEIYPAIDPKSSALSQSGKVIIITGASQGFGKDVSTSASDLSLGFVLTSLQNCRG